MPAFEYDENGCLKYTKLEFGGSTVSECLDNLLENAKLLEDAAAIMASRKNNDQVNDVIADLKIEVDNMQTVMSILKLKIELGYKRIAECRTHSEKLAALNNNIVQFLSREDFREKTEEGEDLSLAVSAPLAVSEGDSFKPSAKQGISKGAVPKQGVKGNKVNSQKLQNFFSKMLKVKELSEEEYARIPNYMKSGNLSLQEINRFVQSFNLTLEKKYDIMTRPLEGLSQKQVTLRNTLRAHDQLIEGVYFVTEEDLLRTAKVKLSKQNLQVLSALLQVHRLKKETVKGVVRFVVIKH